MYYLNGNSGNIPGNKVSSVFFFAYLKRIPFFKLFIKSVCNIKIEGAQWLSGGVINSRPKGNGFKPHQHHCVLSLSKTH